MDDIETSGLGSARDSKGAMSGRAVMAGITRSAASATLPSWIRQRREGSAWWDLRADVNDHAAVCTARPVYRVPASSYTAMPGRERQLICGGTGRAWVGESGIAETSAGRSVGRSRGGSGGGRARGRPPRSECSRCTTPPTCCVTSISDASRRLRRLVNPAAGASSRGGVPTPECARRAGRKTVQSRRVSASPRHRPASRLSSCAR